MEENVKAMIADALVRHLMQRVSNANPRPMYGGTVFELEVDNPKSRIGGVYAYDGHVSLEFAQGKCLVDQHGVLDGHGKHRRHIKLRSMSDIDDMHCKHYLDLAIAHFDA